MPSDRKPSLILPVILPVAGVAMMLLGFGIYLRATRDSSVVPEPSRAIVVTLGSPVEELADVSWPIRKGDWDIFAVIERPAQIRVLRRGREIVDLQSRLTFLNQSKGRVSRVTLHPLTEAVDCQSAINELKSCIRKIAPSALLDQIEGWRTATPEPYQGSLIHLAHSELNDGTELWVEVKQVYGGHGCFFSVQLGIPTYRSPAGFCAGGVFVQSPSTG